MRWRVVARLQISLVHEIDAAKIDRFYAIVYHFPIVGDEKFDRSFEYVNKSETFM